MRPDDVLLSAYLDGEVPERYRAEIEASIASDPAVNERYSQLERLHQLLREDSAADIRQLMDRGFASVMRRVAVRPNSRFGLWWRQIQVPIPAVAAAAVVLVVLTGILIWSFVPKPLPAAPDYLAQGKDIDVTIRVDDANMERVLQWLVDKQMLGEVSIQLPEQQFRIVGEPVLLKPGRYPEGFSE